MEQIEFILTQYGVFLLAAGILLLWLQQLVILRKLTKTRRQIEAVRKEVVNSRDMLLAEAKEMRKQEREEEEKMKSITADADQTRADQVNADQINSDQGELIDAVLSEVFS